MRNVKRLVTTAAFLALLAGCNTSTSPLTADDVIAGLKTACNFQVIASTANTVIGALINAYVPQGGTLTAAVLTQIETDVCAQVKAQIAEPKATRDGTVTITVHGVAVTGKVGD